MNCDLRLRTWVDSAFDGSQDEASFFSAPVSFPDSGPARATITSQNTSTSHLVRRPAGAYAIARKTAMPDPPVALLSLIRRGRALQVIGFSAAPFARHQPRCMRYIAFALSWQAPCRGMLASRCRGPGFGRRTCESAYRESRITINRAAIPVKQITASERPMGMSRPISAWTFHTAPPALTAATHPDLGAGVSAGLPWNL